MSKVLISRDLIEEAMSYTSCPSWSPSLTEELRAALAAPQGATAPQADTRIYPGGFPGGDRARWVPAPPAENWMVENWKAEYLGAQARIKELETEIIELRLPESNGAMERQRIKLLEAEVKQVNFDWQQCDTAYHELLAENAALRVDAERYRFWRDRYPTTFPDAEDWTPERIDKATDNAMKGEAP